jgi:hypothetical protein
MLNCVGTGVIDAAQLFILPQAAAHPHETNAL